MSKRFPQVRTIVGLLIVLVAGCGCEYTSDITSSMHEHPLYQKRITLEQDMRLEHRRGSSIDSLVPRKAEDGPTLPGGNEAPIEYVSAGSHVVIERFMKWHAPLFHIGLSSRVYAVGRIADGRFADQLVDLREIGFDYLDASPLPPP